MKGTKARSQFKCQGCGAVEAKWTGRCKACGAWSSMVEEEVLPAAPRGLTGGGGATAVPWSSRGDAAASHAAPLTEAGRRGGAVRSQAIMDVDESASAAQRLRSSLPAVDRVLGGGLVAGSLVLLGGDPGIGKSTLLLQLLQGLCQASGDGPPVLYISGEESAAQVALRARRLAATAPGLRVLAETRLAAIVAEAERVQPRVLAIDSIQTVQVEGIDSVPGSLTQVREAALRLLPLAKERGVATVLVGHVTKDGTLAGPKTLEHLVDAVLLFEGERGHPFRVLRASKNRFGATSELAVFEMRGEGLAEVPDPSTLFLAERPRNVPGSAVTATLSGSLPLLLEVQALVAQPAGVPRRTAIGIDPNRVSMLLAVLERRAGIDALGLDVFVNIAGGLRLEETAADLAVVAALASSAARRPVDAAALCFGEVGLAGEVRTVGQPESRLQEGAKLGFRRAVIPEATARLLRQSGRQPAGVEVIGVRDVGMAIDALLDAR